MKLIDKWLKGNRNFYTGKAIYKAIGKDAHLLRLLENIPSVIIQNLLEKALTELNQHKTQPKLIEQDKETVLMPDSADPVLKAVKSEWMKPYQDMNFKRHQLHKFGNSNHPDHIKIRKELAFDILDLEQECIRIWAKRDYYTKYGKLPDIRDTTDTLFIAKDPVQLAKQIEASKRKIRDWRSKMKADASNSKAVIEYQKSKDQYKVLTGYEYEEVTNNG